MKTTDYLDALRAHYDLPSDYALAKKWGVSRQFISNYRSGRHTFDDSNAIKVANWLNIDPAIVLADMHAERSKTPEARAAWRSIAKRLTSAAAALLLGFVVLAGSVPGPTFAAIASADCILCKIQNLLIYRGISYFFKKITYAADIIREWPIFRIFTPPTLTPPPAVL